MRPKMLSWLLFLLLMWGGVDDLILSTSNIDPSEDTAAFETEECLPPTPRGSPKQEEKQLEVSSSLGP